MGYYRTRRQIWGKERTCILSYSQKLYDGQVKELEETIVKAIKSLEELNEKLNNSRSRMDKTEKGMYSRIKKLTGGKYSSDIIKVQLQDNQIIYGIDEVEKQEIMDHYFGKN